MTGYSLHYGPPPWWGRAVPKQYHIGGCFGSSVIWLEKVLLYFHGSGAWGIRQLVTCVRNAPVTGQVGVGDVSEARP